MLSSGYLHLRSLLDVSKNILQNLCIAFIPKIM